MSSGGVTLNFWLSVVLSASYLKSLEHIATQINTLQLLAV